MNKEYIKIKTADLIPYERNPRKITQEAIDVVKESIIQCGNLDPIEIDEDNVILSGHTRRLALQELGIEETDAVRYTGMTEEQKKKYRLLANKTGEFSAWDYELLDWELEDLNFEGFDFGFECHDTMEDIDDENIGGLTNVDHILRIDKQQYAMTEEEYNTITELAKQYVDENGVSFGFVRWLCDGKS